MIPCLMGSCQECLVLVNDRIVLACQEIVEEGIIIKTGINK
jgi:succinate dehydrogenase/fumarate reductase-like Fe-S protein